MDKAGRAPRSARRPADKARIGRHTGRIPTGSQRRAKRSDGMSSPIDCRPALSTGCQGLPPAQEGEEPPPPAGRPRSPAAPGRRPGPGSGAGSYRRRRPPRAAANAPGRRSDRRRGPPRQGGAASPTAAAWIFRSVGSGPLPGAMAVKAVGVGENARIRAAKADAASVQSRARSRLPMRGARLAAEFSWGAGSMVPRANPSSVSIRSSAPMGASRARRRPPVSSFRIGARRCASTGPVSSPASISIVVTPVCGKPRANRPGGGGRPAKFGKQRSVDIHGRRGGGTRSRPAGRICP